MLSSHSIFINNDARTICLCNSFTRVMNTVQWATMCRQEEEHLPTRTSAKIASFFSLEWSNKHSSYGIMSPHSLALCWLAAGSSRRRTPRRSPRSAGCCARSRRRIGLALIFSRHVRNPGARGFVVSTPRGPPPADAPRSPHGRFFIVGADDSPPPSTRYAGRRRSSEPTGRKNGSTRPA